MQDHMLGLLAEPAYVNIHIVFNIHDWWTEFRFNVPLHIETSHIGNTVPSQSLVLVHVLKKLTFTQKLDMHNRKSKDTMTKINIKTKPRFGKTFMIFMCDFMSPHGVQQYQ